MYPALIGSPSACGRRTSVTTNAAHVASASMASVARSASPRRSGRARAARSSAGRPRSASPPMPSASPPKPSTDCVDANGRSARVATASSRGRCRTSRFQSRRGTSAAARGERRPVRVGHEVAERERDVERARLSALEHVPRPLEVRLDRVAEARRLVAPPRARDHEEPSPAAGESPSDARRPTSTAATLVRARRRAPSGTSPSRCPARLPRRSRPRGPAGVVRADEQQHRERGGERERRLRMEGNAVAEHDGHRERRGRREERRVRPRRPQPPRGRPRDRERAARRGEREQLPRRRGTVRGARTVPRAPPMPPRPRAARVRRRAPRHAAARRGAHSRRRRARARAAGGARSGRAARRTHRAPSWYAGGEGYSLFALGRQPPLLS